MTDTQRCRSSWGTETEIDINILVTSAGRRTGLVAAFLEAAHARGARVVAADIDALAPALHLADDPVRVPPLTDPGYLDALGGIVEEHRVRLIVPTIDTELAVLARGRAGLAAAGAIALVSRESLLMVAGDKVETSRTFAAAGFSVPRWWTPDDLTDELPERLFIKPRAGSASAHTYATTPGDLPFLIERVPNPIIQEFIDAPEITIDALLDLDGQPLHFVPRHRIRTLAGESIQGVTVSDEPIRDWTVALLGTLSELGAIGPMTIQAFLTDGGPVLSEVNPRFGGGFPLTNEAGGRYPEWLVRMIAGETVPPRFGEYRVGVYMTRAATEYYTEAPRW